MPVIRLLIYIAYCFISLVVAAQVDTSWHQLPDLKGLPAKISSKPLQVERKYTKEPSFRIRKKRIPYTLALHGPAPQKWDSITFTKYPILYGEAHPRSSGLIFKDESNQNIKYQDKAHGFPDNIIFAIAEDSSGVMFFAGKEGLYYYNGYTAYEMGYGSSTFANPQALHYDDKKRLWVGGRDLLGYFQNGYFYKYDHTKELEVYNFNSLPDGSIAISTKNHSLMLFREGRVLKYEEAIPDPWMTYCVADASGRMWMSNERGSPMVQIGDSIFTLKSIYQARSFQVVGNKLWIGTFFNGLYLLEGDSLYELELHPHLEKFAGHHMAYSRDALWIACYPSGVLKITNDFDTKYFTASSGLSGSDVFNVLPDSYGNVWVSHLGSGISRIDPAVLERDDHPKGSYTDAVFQEEEGWYFGNGQYLTREDKQSYELLYNEAYGSDAAFSTSGFKEGDSVWMSMYGHGLGLVEYDKKKFTTFGYSNDYFRNSLFYPKPDLSGGIWCVSLDKRLIYFKDHLFYDYSDSQMLSEVGFEKIQSANDGALFAYTEEGVMEIKNGKFCFYDLSVGLPSGKINYCFRDTQNILWLFTENRLYLIDTAGQKSDYDFPSSIVKDVLQVSDAQWYAITSEGILSIVKTAAGFEYFLIDETYGLGLINNSWIGRKPGGEILLGGKNNTFEFHPEKVNQNRPVPKLTLSDKFPVKHHHRQNEKIQIYLDAISWGRPLRIFYKLTYAGINTTPWYDQKENVIEFNNLGHGAYELQVIADDGLNQSEPLLIDLVVEPWWYQTKWFYLLIGLCSVIIMLTIISYNQKKARRRENRLKQLVAEKTREIRMEKNEVQRSLEEKEVLLYEINHRVKNNLQIIASILEMQSDNIDNRVVKEVLKSSKGKVQTMALIHQKLYQNDHLDKIDFHDYLNELCRDIQTSFKELAFGTRIDVNAEGIELSLQQAIPLGMIVNELLTNSLKYSLKDSNGNVMLRCFESDGYLNMSFNDNGPGYPPEVLKGQSSTLGMRLITILSRQLGGQAYFQNRNGAYFLLKIPAK